MNAFLTLIPFILIRFVLLSLINKVNTDQHWLYTGSIIYGIGALLCLAPISAFAKPAENCFNHKGLYRVSRNPMYVSYFVYFLGCVLLTKSMILLALLLVFQISTHWIILSEERWCIKKFGNEYIKYMSKVRRYI